MTILLYVWTPYKKDVAKTNQQGLVLIVVRYTMSSGQGKGGGFHQCEASFRPQRELKEV